MEPAPTVDGNGNEYQATTGTNGNRNWYKRMGGNDNEKPFSHTSNSIPGYHIPQTLEHHDLNVLHL